MTSGKVKFKDHPLGTKIGFSISAALLALTCLSFATKDKEKEQTVCDLHLIAGMYLIATTAAAYLAGREFAQSKYRTDEPEDDPTPVDIGHHNDNAKLPSPKDIKIICR